MCETTLPLLNLAGRQRVQVARLEAADRDAVVAMLGRCSATTLQRRFHAVTDGVPYVTRLLTNVSGEIGFGAWLAGRCVGLASLHAFNRTSADPLYLWYLDADNNGSVDATDVGQFKARFNTNVFG